MRTFILLILLGISTPKNQVVQETYQFKQLSNYKIALRESKDNKKLTLLYFSASGSVPCEMMKDELLVDPAIKQLLNQKFCSFEAVTNDRAPLPKAEQYISKLDNKPILTVGKRSTDIQVSNFKTNIQPFFVIIDENEQQIRHLIGKSNTKDFIKFLVGK